MENLVVSNKKAWEIAREDFGDNVSYVFSHDGKPLENFHKIYRVQYVEDNKFKTIFYDMINRREVLINE